MHLVVDAFLGRTATVYDREGGTQVGAVRLAKRRRDPSEVELHGDRWHVTVDPEVRRRWQVRAAEADATAPSSVTIERPSSWRPDVDLRGVDGRRREVRSTGWVRRRLTVTDPDAGDAPLGRMIAGTKVLRTVYDLELDGLDPAEQVASLWVVLTQARSDHAAVGAIIAAGGAAAAGG